MDDAAAVGPLKFLRQMQALVPRLYAAGSELPRVEPNSEHPAPRMPLEQYQAVHRALSQLLGSYDLYWEVYDPAKAETDEVVCTTLSDDLGDVYHDLATGLSQQPSDPRGSWNDAVWEWQFSWESHWGAHAADAIRAIHWHLDPARQRESLDWGDAADADA